jgi:hypothetical protein
LVSEEVKSLYFLLCNTIIYVKADGSFLVNVVSLGTLKKVTEKQARKSWDCGSPDFTMMTMDNLGYEFINHIPYSIDFPFIRTTGRAHRGPKTRRG